MNFVINDYIFAKLTRTIDNSGPQIVEISGKITNIKDKILIEGMPLGYALENVILYKKIDDKNIITRIVKDDIISVHVEDLKNNFFDILCNLSTENINNSCISVKKCEKYPLLLQLQKFNNIDHLLFSILNPLEHILILGDNEAVISFLYTLYTFNQQFLIENSFITQSSNLYELQNVNNLKYVGYNLDKPEKNNILSQLEKNISCVVDLQNNIINGYHNNNLMNKLSKIFFNDDLREKYLNSLNELKKNILLIGNKISFNEIKELGKELELNINKTDLEFIFAFVFQQSYKSDFDVLIG